MNYVSLEEFRKAIAIRVCSSCRRDGRLREGVHCSVLRLSIYAEIAIPFLSVLN